MSPDNDSIESFIMNDIFNETDLFYSTTDHPSYYGSYAPPPFCSQSGEAYNIFYLIIFAICTMLIIPLTRRYIVTPSDDNKTGSRASNRKHSKVHRNVLKWSGIAYALLSFVYLGLYSPMPYVMCITNPMEWSETIAPINLTVSTLYFVQYMSLIFLTFFRIYITFKHSPLQFSKIILWYYGILWILLIIVVVSFPVMMGTIESMERLNYIDQILLVIDATFWLLVILTVSTAILFIYKLVKVVKMDSNSDDNGKLISIISKTALLTLFAMIMTVLTYIINTMDLGLEPGSEIGRCIASTMIGVDVYSNFICFMLTYNSAEKYYVKLCGCCDSKCQSLCLSIVNRENKSTGYLKREITDSTQPSQVSMTTSVPV